MANAAIPRERTCKQCGLGYIWLYGATGQTRGCCSLACFRVWECDQHKARRATGYRSPGAAVPKRALPPTPCVECGDLTKRPRFCSARCSQKARDRRLGVRTRDVVNAERAILATVECPQCCRSFKRTNYTKPSLYCSKRCAFSSRAWKAAVSHERTLYERWARRNRVPDWREAALVRQIRRDLIGAIICYVHNPLLPCRECGEPMGSKHAKQRYCSACGERRDKARKRAHEAQRRARERMLPFDRFDPFEVLERDGWRCHMCGCKTPKRLRGSYAPNAPELDHIVPLAKGGPHTKANTACSCRKCNGMKGDREYGQLRLLAA